MAEADKPQARKVVRSAIDALEQGRAELMHRWLHEHLFGQVLDFWIGRAIDPAGGITSCITDEGKILSRDKWLWSQWRAVWVFSRLYNRIDQQQRWLSLAGSIAEFCIRHGWDEESQAWRLAVRHDGAPLRGAESIYTDAFAVSGLAEYYRATGSEAVRQLACRSADLAIARLGTPRDRIPHFPYPIPSGASPHGLPMIWSHALSELASVVDSEAYRCAAEKLSDEIFRDFYRAKRGLIVEFVGLDGKEYPAPQGTAVVPGHVIEGMWFELHRLRDHDRNRSRQELALRLILQHLEAGWDTQWGGLLLAIDAEGRPEVGWNFPEAKLWWPHTEALYATLLGWRMTGDSRFLEWYRRLWDICLEHYVNYEHGEWHQRFDRKFETKLGTVALPVKDPFHLCRSLILQLELLQPE